MAIKVATKNSSFDGKLQFPLNTTRLCDGRGYRGGFDTIQLFFPQPPIKLVVFFFSFSLNKTQQHSARETVHENAKEF